MNRFIPAPALPSDALRVDTTPTPADTGNRVLSSLGGFALGFAAVINLVIAGAALIGGGLIGAVGSVAQKVSEDPSVASDAPAQLASDASHAALIAKLVALGFAILAGTEFAAAAFLKRRVRTNYIPVACAITVVGEVGFSVWGGHFSALAAILMGCAMFAAFTWFKLPRSAPPQT